MTGGLAWVFDEDQTMVIGERYHAEFLEAVPYAQVGAEQQAALKELVGLQAALAQSRVAERMLAEWATVAEKFVLFTPKPQA
jgi:glutamate synthase (NADPH/NADH) large chain